MLELLSAVVLAAHLVCMNVASAGPLLCVWLDRRAARQDLESQAAARFLANTSFRLLIIGGLLGIVEGFLHWDADYRALLARFAPRITWGVVEFVFSAVLIAVYALWIGRKPVVRGASGLLRATLAILAATNLLYHFPPLFSMLAGAAAGQLEIGPVVDSKVFRQLLVRGEVMALTAHFVVASFAVASILLLAFGAGLWERTANERPRIAVRGGQIALLTTILQIPVGIWLIVQLPPRAQRSLMGEDIWSATMLIAALLASFWLLHQLAAVAFGEVSRAAARRALLTVAMIIMLMTGVLQRTQLRQPEQQKRGTQNERGMRYVAGCPGTGPGDDCGRLWL